MRVLFLVVVLLLAGCPAKQKESESVFVGADISGASMGADFALQDPQGKVRHLSDFRGKVVALFFGYTHCPDVCPTTMADLARALAFLGKSGKGVQVLFVTLDPARDTEEVLGSYVPSFNTDFVGLRADELTTKKVAQEFKIFFSRQESGSKGGYSIDHSAGVYVYDKNGVIRLYLNHGQSPKDIAHDFGMLLNE